MCGVAVTTTGSTVPEAAHRPRRQGARTHTEHRAHRLGGRRVRARSRARERRRAVRQVDRRPEHVAHPVHNWADRGQAHPDRASRPHPAASSSAHLDVHLRLERGEQHLVTIVLTSLPPRAIASPAARPRSPRRGPPRPRRGEPGEAHRSANPRSTTCRQVVLSSRTRSTAASRWRRRAREGIYSRSGGLDSRAEPASAPDRSAVPRPATGRPRCRPPSRPAGTSSDRAPWSPRGRTSPRSPRCRGRGHAQRLDVGRRYRSLADCVREPEGAPVPLGALEDVPRGRLEGGLVELRGRSRGRSPRSRGEGRRHPGRRRRHRSRAADLRGRADAPPRARAAGRSRAGCPRRAGPRR